MEEENGTEGGEEGSHHAGLEWEGILRSYQEGGHPIIPIDCQLVEQDWGKPLLTQLPWEDVLFENLLPCLQVNCTLLLSSLPSLFSAQRLVGPLPNMQVLQQDGK